jgi:hypothetical protein
MKWCRFRAALCRRHDPIVEAKLLAAVHDLGGHGDWEKSLRERFDEINPRGRPFPVSTQ